MLQILCSSVRVELPTLAKLIFLKEQPDDFFSVGNPDYIHAILLYCLLSLFEKLFFTYIIFLYDARHDNEKHDSNCAYRW